MADLKVSQFPFLGMAETLNLETDKLAGSFDTGGSVFVNRGITARDILTAIQNGEPDPFPQYLTSDIADSLYEPIGSSVQNVITYTNNRSSVSADVGSWLRFDSETDVTYYISLESTPTLTLGKEIYIEQVNTGKVTVEVNSSADGAVLIQSGRNPQTSGSGTVIVIKKVVDLPSGSSDRYLVYGDTSSTSNQVTQCIAIAVSDETTAITAGTNKVTFRMPYAFTLTEIRGSLSTAQTSGSIFTVNVNEDGSTILSTKLTIDNAGKTSTTATTPLVISDVNLANDSEITIDVDQIGDGTAKGLKVYLIGYKV